jgi:hypothetical protein
VAPSSWLCFISCRGGEGSGADITAGSANIGASRRGRFVTEDRNDFEDWLRGRIRTPIAPSRDSPETRLRPWKACNETPNVFDFKPSRLLASHLLSGKHLRAKCRSHFGRAVAPSNRSAGKRSPDRQPAGKGNRAQARSSARAACKPSRFNVAEPERWHASSGKDGTSAPEPEKPKAIARPSGGIRFAPLLYRSHLLIC